jgi:hypothetical protein
MQRTNTPLKQNIQSLQRRLKHKETSVEFVEPTTIANLTSTLSKIEALRTRQLAAQSFSTLVPSIETVSQRRASPPPTPPSPPSPPTAPQVAPPPPKIQQIRPVTVSVVREAADKLRQSVLNNAISSVEQASSVQAAENRLADVEMQIARERLAIPTAQKYAFPGDTTILQNVKSAYTNMLQNEELVDVPFDVDQIPVITRPEDRLNVSSMQEGLRNALSSQNSLKSQIQTAVGQQAVTKQNMRSMMDAVKVDVAELEEIVDTTNGQHIQTVFTEELKDTGRIDVIAPMLADVANQHNKKIQSVMNTWQVESHSGPGTRELELASLLESQQIELQAIRDESKRTMQQNDEITQSNQQLKTQLEAKHKEFNLQLPTLMEAKATISENARLQEWVRKASKESEHKRLETEDLQRRVLSYENASLSMNEAMHEMQEKQHSVEQKAADTIRQLETMFTDSVRQAEQHSKELVQSGDIARVELAAHKALIGQEQKRRMHLEKQLDLGVVATNKIKGQLRQQGEQMKLQRAELAKMTELKEVEMIQRTSAMESSNSQLRNENAELIAELNAQNSSLQKKLDEPTGTTESTVKIKEQLRQQMELQRAELAKMTELKEVEMKQKTSAMEENAKMKREVEEMRGSNTQLITELNAQNSSLQKKLDESTGTTEALMEEVNDCRQKPKGVMGRLWG